jgi:hypothetical protein
VPSLLVFENNDLETESMQINPTSVITIPDQAQANTLEYHLAAIIYHGTYHFTARIIHQEESWSYDGQRNNGEAEKETQTLNAQDLQVLGDRRAHILLYTLKSSLNGKPASMIWLVLLLTHPAPKIPLNKP